MKPSSLILALCLFGFAGCASDEPKTVSGGEPGAISSDASHMAQDADKSLPCWIRARV